MLRVSQPLRGAEPTFWLSAIFQIEASYCLMHNKVNDLKSWAGWQQFGPGLPNSKHYAYRQCLNRINAQFLSIYTAWQRTAKGGSFDLCAKMLPCSDPKTLLADSCTLAGFVNHALGRTYLIAASKMLVMPCSSCLVSTVSLTQWTRPARCCGLSRWSVSLLTMLRQSERVSPGLGQNREGILWSLPRQANCFLTFFSDKAGREPFPRTETTRNLQDPVSWLCHVGLLLGWVLSGSLSTTRICRLFFLQEPDS